MSLEVRGSLLEKQQQAMKQELFEFKLETRERFKQIDKRFDQLELLIRQTITHN